jgi:PAS domain S-box-containing protein
MKRLSSMSIKYQLMFLIVSVTSIVLLAGFLVGSWIEIKTYRNSLQDESRLQAALVSDYCAVPLVFFDDTKGLEEVLQKLVNIPDVLSASVISKEGLLLGSYKKTGSTNIVPKIEPKGVEGFTSNGYHVVHKIVFDGRNYGTLQMMISTKTLQGKINNNILRSLVLFLGYLILAILISSRYHRIISRPLLSLTKAVESISFGDDLSIRVAKDRDDEIGLLYDGFNNMMARIQARELERDQSRHELQKSEIKYRAMIANLVEGFYSSNMEGDLMEHNAEFCKIFGLDPTKNHKGTHLSDFWQNNADRNAYVTEIKKKGIIRSLVFNGKKINGEKIIVQVNSQLLRNEQGEAIRIEGTFMDVTELKMAESKIKENEKLMAEVSWIAKIGAWEFDAQTLEGTWTDEAARIYDLDPHAPTNASIGIGLYQGEHKQRIENAIHEAIQNGQPYDLELELCTAKDQKKWVRAIGYPIKEGNKVVKVRGTIQDITSRRLAENDLADYAARVQILHEMDISILASESTESIAFDALRRVNALVSFKKASVVGLNVEQNSMYLIAATPDLPKEPGYVDLFCIDEPEFGISQGLLKGKVQIVKNLKAKSNQSSFAKELHDQGLETLVIVPLMAENKLIGALSFAAESYEVFTKSVIEVAQDVASQLAMSIHQFGLRKEIIKYTTELEDRVAERTAQLQIVNRELESFSYSVSHDLRAPLRHIVGFTSLLKSGLPEVSKDSDRYIRKISESSLKMNKMIDDLLSFSRLGRKDLKKSKVDLNLVVQDCIKHFEPETKNRNIKWIVGKLPTLSGDSSLLQLVFENLISNAIKYTSKNEETVIEIDRCSSEKSENCFFIKDNGVGFNMAYASKLFGVFQRLHTEAEFEGTGIGLANVKQIIRKHGGEVWAEAEPGKGAVFFVNLKTS